MATGYSKEFLIEAFVSRYVLLGVTIENRQRELATALYDKVGKDKFRDYASLDAKAIKEYKNYLELCS